MDGLGICAPACKPNPNNVHFPLCPNATKGSTATPYCEFNNNGASKPTNCGLICNTTGTKIDMACEFHVIESNIQRIQTGDVVWLNAAGLASRSNFSTCGVWHVAEPGAQLLS